MRGTIPRPALASRSTPYALVVDTEMPAPRVRDELRELRVAQMDQRRVVTSLEVNLGLVGNAVVNDDVELIANTNRRNSAVSAVLEECVDFTFPGQIDVFAKLLL
jgi:hypothetical protein